MRVLLAEDDKKLGNLLKYMLEKNEIAAEWVTAGDMAYEYAIYDEYDILVLDWMMPDGEGIDVCRKLRGQKVQTGILMLTARDTVEDRVVGLDAGADDYMVKPFEMLELLVRIEKVLERTGRARKVLTIRNIMVDVQSHQVLKDGIPVNLKPMAYDLFVLLLQNKNIALGREELLKRVWGEDYLGESRTVDVHIGQLRKKLELYDEIKTIPKLGYRLEE